MSSFLSEPMLKSLDYYMGEATYRISRTFRWVQGKALQFSLRTVMGGGAATVANKLSPAVHDAMNASTASSAQAATMSAGEILMSSVGGLVGIGAGVGISAYLNHMEFKHREKQLCELYRPQIASILGKQPGLVTVQDLHVVAETNPTLQKELERNRSDRNIKNTGTILGTVAAFAAVFAAVTLFPVVAPALAAAVAGWVTTGASIVLGFATHQLARSAVSKIGRKMKGLDEPSVENKVNKIAQLQVNGRVSPVPVLDIFVSAQPELAEAIQAEYGKPFKKMSFEERKTVLERYDAALGISGIVDALNKGEMRAQELTFRAHGQASGVAPDTPWKEKLKEAAQQKLDPVQQRLSQSVDKFQQWRSERQQEKLKDEVAEAMEKGKPLPEKAQALGDETYWRDTINSRRAMEKAGAVRVQ